jgi:hypothetical protein
MIVPMPFGTLKGQKAFLFLSWFLFSSIFFNYITKDASNLHFKLGSNGKPNYFSTSILSGHTFITMANLFKQLIVEMERF